MNKQYIHLDGVWNGVYEISDSEELIKNASIENPVLELTIIDNRIEEFQVHIDGDNNEGGDDE